MDKSKDLKRNGFTHQFGFFGHGWGHCVVCHYSVEVQSPEEHDKKCPGPMPKRLSFPGFPELSYTCCSRLTDEDWKKIAAAENKAIKNLKGFKDEVGISGSNQCTSASKDISHKECNVPCHCDEKSKKQKKRFPWLTVFLGLIVLGTILYSAIWGIHNPLTFPGQFGY